MPDQATFAARHIGPDADAVAAMLAVIGVDSLDELAAKAVPAGILDTLTSTGAAPGLDELPPAVSEAKTWFCAASPRMWLSASVSLKLGPRSSGAA